MFIPNTDPKSASRPCWHRGDDTQRSQGEYSKYGHDKLTAHEESAEREISILTPGLTTLSEPSTRTLLELPEGQTCKREMCWCCVENTSSLLSPSHIELA